MKKLNKAISDHYPSLGRIKRYIKALIDKLCKERQSYSQYGEDDFIISELGNRDASKIQYLDIGANHPSIISNTYKLYKQGFKGITIEPNRELIGLHKTFRPRDIQLCVGCGAENKIEEFFFSKTPVLSSFRKSMVKNIWYSEYLPIFKVDTILTDFDITEIFFLNIDVEGKDFDVLKGATNTLQKTHILCIEVNNTTDESLINDFLCIINFEFVFKTQCNHFYKNKVLKN